MTESINEINKSESDVKSDDLNKKKDLTESSPPQKPIKPPKPEDKPFKEFINEEFIPSLKQSLVKRGVESNSIELIEAQRPVVGGKCSMVYGQIDHGRRFWLSFSEEKITSLKNISLAERGSEPFLLESFLIDEKKTTLALLVSRLLQRLNGQKWLDAN